MSLFFLSGCNQSNRIYKKPYFDFDSPISQQTQLLVQANIMLHKKTQVNKIFSDSTFTIDSLKLARELEVFRQIDVINKPLFRDSYSVYDGEKDNHSNLLVRTYRFIPKDSTVQSPVPFIKIYYQDTPLIPKKIESVYQEKNSLYATKRILLLAFDDETGKNLISTYELKGTQKMILSDTTWFSVHGTFSISH